MIESSAAYLAAVTGDSRRVLLKAAVDITSPDIEFGGATASSRAPWVKDAELHDRDTTTARYATLEHNRFVLDGSFDIFPSGYQVPEHMGFAGATLAGADGTFSPAAWVTLNFSNVSILQACSVYFPTDALEGVAEDFAVEILSGGEVFYSKSFTGNAASSVSLDGFTVYSPDAIRVTVTKWSLPYRYLRVTEILPGLYEEWDAGVLADFGVEHRADVSCLTLPYGTCTLSMDNLSRRFEPRAKNGLFQSIEERQGIEVLLGVRLAAGSTEWKRAGVFYQAGDGWKTGENALTMQWALVDIIGLLASREYVLPEVLPVTLAGWVASLVSQLGDNFESRYSVDEDYAELPVTASARTDIEGKSCGELLRWACMATGTFPRADAETGFLAVEPLWSAGNKVTLDNLNAYPTMKANDSLALLTFKLYDGAGTSYAVSGNSTSAAKTVSIDNPFLHTAAQALTAARLILSCYGGNKLELTGRGDPASEIGDVDTVWLDESSATTARRISQTFKMSGGVLQGCKSTLLQADGSFLFQNRVTITTAQTWTAPAGVTQLRLILVGHGGDGGDGTDGSWDAAGADGADGLGALVWAGTVSINEGQSFEIALSENATFGAYSSANGKRFPYGYTDIASGDSFARTGVSVPESGTGDGGAGGKGGVKGNRREVSFTVEREDGSSYTDWKTVIDNSPGKGKAGVPGASGCIVIYYDKEET